MRFESAMSGVAIQEVEVGVLRYLVGERDLRQFAMWLHRRIWRDDERTPRIALKVELLLAEYTSSHRSEDELKVALVDLLPPTMNPTVVRWNAA